MTINNYKCFEKHNCKYKINKIDVCRQCIYCIIIIKKKCI